MASPTVDILMATYNGASYIYEQIESIQQQSYPNWRLLISDDCSTDDTLEIVKSLAQKDGRIKIVSEGTRYGGAKENFIELMRHADAPYIMFCDQDDIWMSNKVESELKELIAAESKAGPSSPVMVHSDLMLVDGKGMPLGKRMSETLGVDPVKANAAQIVLTGCTTGCTMAFNRRCIEKALLATNWTNIIMHDWWIALIASFLGRRVYINECLVLYRQHGNNTIGALDNTASEVSTAYRTTIKTAGFEGVRRRLAKPEVKRIRQAQSFLDYYRYALSDHQVRLLSDITSLPSLSRINRLVIISHYQLWRRGFSKRLRQFMAMMALTSF